MLAPGDIEGQVAWNWILAAVNRHEFPRIEAHRVIATHRQIEHPLDFKRIRLLASSAKSDGLPTLVRYELGKCSARVHRPITTNKMQYVVRRLFRKMIIGRIAMQTPYALKIEKRRRDVRTRRRFVSCLIFSAGIAAFGFSLGPIYYGLSGSEGIPVSAIVSTSIVIAWLWLTVFAASLCLCRALGLWLLAQAPFVLSFPACFVFSGACSLLAQCV